MEGMFPEMKLGCRGRGLLIGEPKVMSLTRKGKWEVMSELLRASHQPFTMYRVVCIYRTELSSVACAGSGSMGGVATQGAGMC